MKASVKTLDAACVAGLLILVTGGTFLTVKVAGAHAARVDRHNETVTARMAELKQAQSVLSVCERALRANQAAMEALRKRLPDDAAMGGFLASLDRLAQESHVELGGVQPGAVVHEELCSRLPVLITCRAGFRNLHTFVYGLEALERLVRIDRLTMRRETADAPCLMELRCNVYGN